MRSRYRVMTVGVVAGLAVAGLAGPALAHVQVSADKSTAGATDVTLTFSGEAENPAAGIKSERVVLPAGIEPAGVTLVKAPDGWTFTRAADGFTVGGKALKTGTDAVWKVKIAKLPDGQTRLSFKTLETYGNGDVSRWIEIQQAGQAEPDNPAPLVTLKPGPAGAATAATSAPAASAPVGPGSTSAAPATTDATTPAASPAPVAVSTSDKSSSTWWIWVVLVAVVVIGGGLLLSRRKRTD